MHSRSLMVMTGRLEHTNFPPPPDEVLDPPLEETDLFAPLPLDGLKPGFQFNQSFT